MLDDQKASGECSQPWGSWDMGGGEDSPASTGLMTEGPCLVQWNLEVQGKGPSVPAAWMCPKLPGASFFWAGL